MYSTGCHGRRVSSNQCRLAFEELVVLGFADQGRASNPVRDVGEVVLDDFVEQFLAGGDVEHP